ncbi:MAG: glutamine--tRNA ligase/YqeY domain fusion protein [Victivallaceae bacterium]|nr:glutamine--tRNA ligase/YqeY domain fusion protein [Victivallaceae bacterium]
MEEKNIAAADAPAKLDFIREIVASDVTAGRNNGKVVTRFPPEPNGYLHIGHAKAISIDFGIASEFGGVCHLRMDDTNPTKEETEYVESIQADVRWLGFEFGEHFYYASDYFDRMYECAEKLIGMGKAYVCDLTAEEFEQYRGNLENPGKNPPGRSRSVEENLALFRRMKAGEFADGEKVLRAAIDMSSPNIHMRDPVIYRIRRTEHFRQGDKWCIYPMYDFAHALEDAFEGITHSICTLEFEIHRPLYDWVVNTLGFVNPPHQYEFARLSLDYTVMSKRKLLQLVKEHYVSGWDDPRMPTISGMRRRGITPEAIRRFCEVIGVTKFNSQTDLALFEHCVREDLNKRCPRYLAVIDPLKVTVTNYPEGETDWLDAVNNPEDPEAGMRKLPFSRNLYIEKSDFMEVPVKGYFRLAPGAEVRLRYGYFLRCNEVVKDASGEIVELKCTIDPATRGGNSSDGRKVKGTIHWVSADHAVRSQVRLYDRLFSVAEPGADGVDFLTQLNPDSLKEATAWMEPELGKVRVGDRVQFERLGYFACDPDSTPEALVFNRTMTLKDSWGRKAAGK